MTVLAAGVDVGGTKIEAVVLDERGTVVQRTRHATAHVVTSPPGSATADVIARALDELLGPNVHVPVGLGLPGMMIVSGRLAYAPNLQSANGADFASLMAERRPGQRVVCVNDADCAAAVAADASTSPRAAMRR